MMNANPSQPVPTAKEGDPSKYIILPSHLTEESKKLIADETEQANQVKYCCKNSLPKKW
jgi:hypothetical protein